MPTTSYILSIFVYLERESRIKVDAVMRASVPFEGRGGLGPSEVGVVEAGGGALAKTGRAPGGRPGQTGIGDSYGPDIRVHRFAMAFMRIEFEVMK